MSSNYNQLNDPWSDAIPLPAETVAVDMLLGGFPGTAFTDLVIDGSANTKVTSAAHPFVAGDVGKILVVMSGTNFTADTYVIVAVDANAVATIGAVLNQRN